MSEIKLCKYEKCSQPVPPSKNKGVERLFCTQRCRVAYNSLKYYAREKGNPAIDGVRRDPDGRPYIARTICQTAKSAETRYDSHLRDCTLSEDRRCPGARDLYGQRRLCLIQAVLAEDWHTLRRREAGQEYERVSTTATGYWL